jgi:hypothetical protein
MHTHPIYWRSVLFLSSHLRLGHLITPSNPVESPPSPTISPNHAHLISLDGLSSIIRWWVPILKMHVLLFHPLVCYLVNYRLIFWTHYSEAPLFCFSLNIGEQVPRPSKPKSKMIFLCILNFITLNNSLEDRRFWNEMNSQILICP